MQHQNDSFGLFADVLAGTLGIVALIALLMVLAAGDWHVTPESKHRDELRSAALPQQVAAATRRAQQSRERLDAATQEVAGAMGVTPAALLARVQTEASGSTPRAAVRSKEGEDPTLALRRENLRLGQRVAELTVMRDALDATVTNLRERPHPVSTARLVEPEAPLRVLREGTEKPKPFYLICSGGKIYVPYQFTATATQLNRQDLSWITLPGGKRWRGLPIKTRGWNVTEMGDQLKTLGPELQRRADYYAVVLAFPDSFWEAREILHLLEAANVSFSWRPYPAGEAVDFAVDGEIPPPPL